MVEENSNTSTSEDSEVQQDAIVQSEDVEQALQSNDSPSSGNTNSTARDFILLNAILDGLPQDTIFQNTRVTREGLFIEEALKEAAVNAYRKFLESEGNDRGEKSEQKLIRRLFGEQTPALHYLLDGKICIPGFLIPLSIAEGKKYSVPFFRGGTISALDYLHLRDPILKQVDGLEAIVDNRGFRIEISSKETVYTLDPAVLTAYAQVLRDDRKLSGRNPEAVTALRGCLRPLVESVRRARPVNAKHHLLIPAKYRKDKSVKFSQIGQTYFVLGRNNQLQDCYGLQGKSLHHFLISEFDSLKASLKGKGVKGFSFEKKNRRIIGYVRIGDKRLSVEPGAFKEFVLEAPYARECRKKLSRFYTLRDCLTRFVDVLQSAKRAERRDLTRFLPKDVKEDARFYLADEFLFLFTPRNTIFSCAAKYPHKGRAATVAGKDSKRGSKHSGRQGGSGQKRRGSRKGRGGKVSNQSRESRPSAGQK